MATPKAAPDSLRLAGTMVQLVRLLDQRLRETNAALTLTELGVLGQIDRGIVFSSQIARAMRLDPARVTHLIDRLVHNGYVSRELDATDRRCWRLDLTQGGKEHLERGRAEMRGTMESLLEGLSAEEQVGLFQGLEGARRLLDAQRNADNAP